MLENKEMPIRIEFNLKITDQDIEDIVVTAIEGGIGYWACLDNTTEEWNEFEKSNLTTSEYCSKLLLDGKKLRFIDDEDRNTSWLLDIDMLLNGIKMYIESCSTDIVDSGCFELDLCNLDANSADCIFQYALFKEIVYG